MIPKAYPAADCRIAVRPRVPHLLETARLGPFLEWELLEMLWLDNMIKTTKGLVRSNSDAYFPGMYHDGNNWHKPYRNCTSKLTRKACYAKA